MRQAQPRVGIRDSYHRLRAAQKSPVGVSLYSRYVNRPFGRLLASAAHVAGLTPNAVTAVSAACSLTGVLLLTLTPPSLPLGILIGTLMILAFAVDSADGQLARLRGGGSPFGEWLDHIVDGGKQVAVHAAVLIAAWRFYEVPTVWLLVPIAMVLIRVVQFSGGILTQFLLPKTEAGEARQPSLSRSFGLLPADEGVVSAAFLLTGVPALFVPVYTLLTLLNALLTGAMVATWVKRFRASSGTYRD